MPRVLFVGKRRKLGVHYYLLNCGKNYARATVVLSSLSRPELGETVGGAGKHDVFFTTLRRGVVVSVVFVFVVVVVVLAKRRRRRSRGMEADVGYGFGVRVRYSGRLSV